MNSTERIKAIINHQDFDRCAVSGWVHMPFVDHNVKDMVKATVMVTDYCGWDFVKVMSTGYYCLEMYGGDINLSKDPTKWYGSVNKYAIEKVEDLLNLPVLDMSNKVMQREVAIAKGIKEHYGDSKPIISTIFTPMTFLQECMERGTHNKTLPWMKEHKAEMHKALRTVVETNKHYLDALINEAHIDGIFYANQYSTREFMEDDLYDEFCAPYDKELLEYIKDRTWFNVLHVHGESKLMFDKCIDYPVQAFSWENCVPGIPETNISHVSEVRAMTDKMLVCGLARHYDYYNDDNNRDELKEFFRKRFLTVKNESKDNRVCFAPGCALPMDVDRYVFTLMKEVVEEDGYNG